MTWLIIAAVLLAAFGPVLWLLPSRRDRRLAAMRQAARQAGLVVELVRIPKTNPSAEDRVSPGGVIRDPVRECASYALPLARSLKFLPSLRLLRAEGADDGPWPGWSYNPRPDMRNPRLAPTLARTEPLLEALPEDAAGLEITPRSVIVFWLESAESGADDVAGLARALVEFADRLAALDRQYEEAAADADS